MSAIYVERLPIQNCAIQNLSILNVWLVEIQMFKEKWRLFVLHGKIRDHLACEFVEKKTTNL